MDRKRIREEVVEIFCAKLHNLQAPSDDDDFDYENQTLVPEITKDPLDIAEVSMDLEDAFGVNFEDTMPGDAGMETIGKVVDYLDSRISRREEAAAKSRAEAEEV